MKNKIDNLFESKLSRRQELPSPGAWEKLERNLQGKKRNRFGGYFKIAAVISVLIVSAIALIQLVIQNDHQASKEVEIENKSTSEIDANQNLAENQEEDLPQEPSLLLNTEPLVKELAHNPSDSDLNENIVKENLLKRKALSSDMAVRGEKQLGKTNQEKAVENDVNLQNLEIEAEKLMVKTEEALKENSQEKLPGITITYKKGKEEKNLIASAESGESLNSPLKRLFKLAKEIREADLSLAELRDSKEDLFALEIHKMKN